MLKPTEDKRDFMTDRERVLFCKHMMKHGLKDKPAE